MTLIIDASVAVKWYAEEDLHAEARALLPRAREFRAPDLVLAEVANAVWRKCRTGMIAREQALSIPIALRMVFSEFFPTAAFVGEALRMALTLQHPVYDCLYLACAEANDGTLITADRRLIAVVRDSRYAHRVRHLAEVEVAPRP